MGVRSTILPGACILAAVLGSSLSGSGTLRWAAPSLAAQTHCKHVTKKVHGHKKRVKVCTHGSAKPTPVPPRFVGPSDLAVDPHGNIVVADQGDHRVVTLSPAGTTLSSWTNAGTTFSTFGQLYGIALDKSGSVYVADAANHLVDKLDLTGKPAAQWSTEGAESGSFPTLLTVAGNGDVFVSDHTAEAVLHLSPSGTLLGKIGKNQFTDPYGVTIGANGNLFVADFGGGRVREFTPAGEAVASWGDGASGSVRLQSPEALAIDPAGNITVTEQGGDIVKFDQSGKLLQDFGAQGTLQLDDPSGLALDSQGNMYVSDFTGNRVEKLSPTGAVLAIWQ